MCVQSDTFSFSPPMGSSAATTPRSPPLTGTAVAFGAGSGAVCALSQTAAALLSASPRIIGLDLSRHAAARLGTAVLQLSTLHLKRPETPQHKLYSCTAAKVPNALMSCIGGAHKRFT